MKFFLILSLFLFAAPLLPAQPNGIAQDSELITVPDGDKFLRWYGYEGRSYFLQVSDANDPLGKWNWAPVIESGNDEDISYEVDGTAPKSFFRLKYTDQVPGPNETLESADFDQDGISNINEIDPPTPLLASDATDPLDSDTDGDGMTDGYERTHGLNANDDGSTDPDNGPNGDPDGDGLTNAQELALTTEPNDPDTDHDGLNDGEEVALTTDPKNKNTDGDYLDGNPLLDGEDADPKEILVNWKRASESSYLLIEVEVPSEYGTVQDLNDNGEVLFSNAIWSGGNYTPKYAPDITGVIPGTVSEAYPDGIGYEVPLQDWSFFNNDKKLLQIGYVRPTEGPGVDSSAPCPVYWPDGQSSANLINDTAGLWETPYWYAWPVGVSAAGEMIVRTKAISPVNSTKKLERFDAAGALAGSMDGTDEFHPSGEWQHGDISSTGWVASNLTREATETVPAAHKVGLWNPSNASVALPAEASGWGYPVRLSDVPNTKVALVAGQWSGETHSGRVFLPDAEDHMQYSSRLSAQKLQLFAGDGTAMTSDNQLWRNGKLTPLRDLCEKWKELEDDGWSLFPLKANKEGIYLIQAEGPEGEAAAFRAIPVNLTIRTAGTFTDIPDDKEESVGAFTAANLNDQDGDAVIDDDDDSVKKVGETGEDEEDLMQLKVEGPREGQMKVTVAGGSVRFWEKLTKETEYPMQNGAIIIEGIDLPKILFVEATAKSQVLRDIQLRLSHTEPDQTVYDHLDLVKATAVWAEKKTIKNTAGAGLWTNDHDPVFKGAFENVIGDWGINFNPPPADPTHSFHYSIGIEFEVMPPGIAQEPGVKFDIARDKAFRDWWITRNPAEVNPVYDPGVDDQFDAGDLADDDALPDNDEDVRGTGNKIYVLDGPGTNLRVEVAAEVVSRNNFKEWVRVRFNGFRPSGNDRSGSRCSDKFNWHARYHVEWDAVTLKFKPKPGTPNDVDIDHIDLGDAPNP